jgi:hypothetical protein
MWLLSVLFRTVGGVTATTEFFRDLTADDARREIVDVLTEPETSVAQRFEGFSEAGVFKLLKAAASAIARLQAFQVHGVAAVDRLRPDQERVQEDLGQALHLTDDDAGFLVTTARALTGRLPVTLSLLDSGKLDLARAGKVVKATAWLSDSAAGVGWKIGCRTRMPSRCAVQPPMLPVGPTRSVRSGAQRPAAAPKTG